MTQREENIIYDVARSRMLRIIRELKIPKIMYKHEMKFHIGQKYLSSFNKCNNAKAYLYWLARYEFTTEDVICWCCPRPNSPAGSVTCTLNQLKPRPWK